MIHFKFSRPRFQAHQWPLGQLSREFSDWKGVTPETQREVARTVLQGLPMTLTLRRGPVGNRFTPIGRRSTNLLGALLDHRDHGECQVYLSRLDEFGVLLCGTDVGTADDSEPFPLSSDDVPLSSCIDSYRRWNVQQRLKNGGFGGLANKLEHYGNAWLSYPLTIHDVIADDAAVQELAEQLDSEA